MPASALPRPRGILFDKDGTLFDFHRTWGRFTETVLDRLAPDGNARDAMARAIGYDPGARRFLAGSPIVAGTNTDIARLWAAFRPDLGAAAIERLLDRTVLAASADPAFPSPAVADLPGLLARLRALGFTLGVATHDTEQAARAQLRTAGVADAFGFVAGYDSGHGLKPGPGMPRAFAAAAGLDPGRFVMVGDSRHDLEAARSGGAALAIGVLTGPATRAELAPLADHVLPSIADLPALLGTWCLKCDTI
ncbi:MAG TPA: HAD family hydrolase [Thermohalobaculum sp.]|nr:HAD family hydrolase [Thermohalobaculum sp.]